MSAVSLEGVSKRFGTRTALRGVSLEIAGGETMAIFGPNGSGKTTLLKLIAGLLRPSNGSVVVFGQGSRDVKGRIGYLGHNPYLYPHLTAAENLEFFARLYDSPRSAAKQSLALVGLGPRSSVPVRQLSRGETQRVALARSLLHDPELLLLDEPFSSLDEQSAQSLPELLKRNGRTVVVATHDAERGRAIAERIVTLEEGRIVTLEDSRMP